MYSKSGQVESQKLFLKYLWKQHGGTRELSRRSGITQYNFRNWRYRGGVSLDYIARLSRAINVPKLGLNYSKLSNLMDNPPAWKTVVGYYGLPRSVVNVILSVIKEKSDERK